MDKIVFTSLAMAAIITTAQAADSLPITPGLWETTSTMNSPFMGSRTFTSQECMKEMKFDPEQMMEGMPQDACKVDTDVSGNTISYDMNCNMQGTQMTGNGSFTVNGDAAKGQMVMHSQVSGQTIEMTMESVAKRISDC